MSNIVKYDGGTDTTTKGFDILSKEWWKSDKNKITAFVMAAVLAYPTFLFLTHGVPWLTTVSWNLTKMLFAIGVTGFSTLILTNKRLWRAFKYLSEFIGRYTLGILIEMNEFNILDMQIEEAEKDRKELQNKGKTVTSQKITLDKKIKDKKKELTDAIGVVKIVEDAIKNAQKNGDYEEVEILSGDLETESTKIAALKDYVDTLTPISEDLGFVEKWYKKVDRLCDIRNKNARITLNIGKDKYDAVMSSSGVARAAWKALMGNDDMNRDAEYALQSLQIKVGKSLADMKNTMELTGDVIRSLEKNNTARARKGIELIRQMEQRGQTEYEAETSGDFQKEIKMTPNSGYANLLLNQPISNRNNYVSYVEVPKDEKEKIILYTQKSDEQGGKKHKLLNYPTDNE